MYDYIRGITYFFWTLSVYIIWAKEPHFEIFYGVCFIFNFENLNLTILKNKTKQNKTKQKKKQPSFKKRSYHLNIEHGVKIESKLNVNF